MNGNLKLLKMTLIAAFAMVAAFALPAANAGAAAFHSSVEPTTLVAEAITNQTFSFGSEAMVCKKESFAETTFSTKTTEELTIHPVYSECSFPSKGVVAQVDMTGCDLKVKAATDEKEMAETSIVCKGAEEEIDVKVTALKVMCATVPQQAIPSATNFGRTFKPIKTLHFIHTWIQRKYKKKSACGEEKTFENLSYEGTVEVDGHNSMGEQTELWYE